jgi:hypothetical protein
MRLGLETRAAIKQKIQNGGGYLFLTLARLLEAYRPRFAPAGTIYLASHSKLVKEYCSGTIRLHFEQIHHLKEALRFVHLLPAHDPDASVVLERCLRRVGAAWGIATRLRCVQEPERYFYKVCPPLF